MVSQVRAVPPLRLIKCGLGDETYALDMSRVRGVERADRLRRELGDDDGSVGRLPGPGAGVEVFSLAARLGRPPRKAAAQQQVVVLDGSPAPWGLLVDRVSQVIAVSAGQLDPLPTLARNHYFRGVVRFDPEFMLLLDPDALDPVPSAGAGDADGIVPAYRPFPILETFGAARRGSPEIVLFVTAEPQRGKRPITFGVSKSQVLEIRESLSLLPVPKTPAFLRGLVNWRSLPVPVVDLGQRLGLPPAELDRRTRLLIVHAFSRSEVVAFLIRPSIRVLPLPVPHAPCRQTLPLVPGLAKAVFEFQSETVVIPDVRCLADCAV